MINRYRKKPAVIEAMQWNGKNAKEIIKWGIDNSNYSIVHIPVKLGKVSLGDKLIISTLEGNHAASVDDYIIKGIKCEFYPCKPDIFKMTYEKVE